jgi:hypothetical protein
LLLGVRDLPNRETPQRRAAAARDRHARSNRRDEKAGANGGAEENIELGEGDACGNHTVRIDHPRGALEPLGRLADRGS